MGAWGLGLFESDDDLDILCELSNAADCDLQPHADIEAARQRLNTGVLSRLVQQRMPDATNPAMCGDFPRESADYIMVILGAAAMQVGAVLPLELKNFMSAHYRSIGLQRDGLVQMEKALREYASSPSPYEICWLLPLLTPPTHPGTSTAPRTTSAARASTRR